MTRIFNPDLPMVIKTDASKYAVGAVLEQEGFPIAFESQRKSDREEYYPAYESELLAIVYALTKWKHFIGTRLVTRETDHATLSRLLTQKKVTTRLGYWQDKLADFNSGVVHKPGKQNLVADALSRCPDYMNSISIRSELPSISTRGNDQRSSRRLEWERAYHQCEDFGDILPICENFRADPEADSNIPVVEDGKEYHWEGGLLWVKIKNNWKLCVPPKNIRREILQGFHDHALAGHPRIGKTTLDIERIFWWPDLKSDTKRYVKSCIASAQGKASYARYGGLLNPLPTPHYPWEILNVDLIMGLPKGDMGYDAIITLVCQLTKMARFTPTFQTAVAERVGKMLVREVIRLHGVPAAIISNRDSRFTSDVWQEMCKRLNITLKMSTAYHPQTDGLAERTNQTIEQMLRCAILRNEHEWVDALPMLEFGYNSTIRSSTRASPFEMLYGFIPCKAVCRKYNLTTTTSSANLPLQAEVILRKARVELERAKATQQKYANRKRRPVGFQIVDYVWLKVSHLPMSGSANSRALSLKHRGPFKIISRVGQLAYRSKLPPSIWVHPVFHVSLLKPVTMNEFGLRSHTSLQVPVHGNEYEVQGISKHRDDPRTKRRWYKVLRTDRTRRWEPESNLLGCQQTLYNYFRGVHQHDVVYRVEEGKPLDEWQPHER
ncbi:retrotransposon ty3-gypsy subclass [Cystoisospora suis]|uniref:Retrotransposon ty3-gypsy subclass n=1 Tax=Cystoisospora suis TaxID=483139 RepID=A0A2C6JYH9_9APIC|nr:retrotransposon ty3-gypsy subclass [Cystoisospora suis]